MKATIYYFDWTHPGQNKEIGDLWMDMHHNDEEETITIKEGVWRAHWTEMPITEEVDGVDRGSLDEIWKKYNSYSTNPYSSDNDPGQKMLKKLGVTHTSMSISDTIKVNGVYYMATGGGYKRVIFK